MTEGHILASPLALIAAAILGYLLGSIPFGLLLTRAAGLGDIRAIGSGNIGTTNVLRTGRKDLAAATLLLDALKGTVAVLAARFFWGAEAAIVAGLFAFVGHIFPVWLKFKGGKGVATYLGLLAAFAWPVAIVFALIWMAVAFTTRYSSASALIASIVSPLALLLFGYPREATLFAVLSAALWYLHRANIGRLLSGTESKIGKKA
jgi:acyl phosphate:glycerol-3-phosphate acyltransferase